MAKYLIQGSTLMAIIRTLRQQGGFYDNVKVSEIPQYISTYLLSYGVFDNLISNPGTSSAKTTAAVPAENFTTSMMYVIEDSTLINIINALREKAGTTGPITVKDIPSFMVNKMVTQELINSLINKTITYIYNSTCTTIGATAFQDCTKLSYVEFTKATTVGSSAFQGCTVLNYLSMPKATTVNTNAFSKCKSVQHLTIGLETIYHNDAVGVMTCDNKNLLTITLPNCKSFYSSVCRSCHSLTQVTAPLLTDLYGSAFYKCSSLQEINLPQCGNGNTWGVGANAFADCTSLRKVTLPLITSMNPSAFANCTALKEFYAPKLAGNSNTPFTNVKSFESVTVGYATVPKLWAGQTNLTYFSDSVATNLAEGAFLGCAALNENGIHLSKLATITANSAFNNTGFVNITPSTFPAFTGSISHYTFQNCTSLKSVNFPGPVYLGRDVFGSCNALTYLSMPNVTSVYVGSNNTPTSRTANLQFVNFNGLVTVPYNLLNGKTQLTTVYIQGATTVNQSAFKLCPALKSVYMNAATVLNAYAFADCPSLTYVSAPALKSITTNYVFANTGFTNVNSTLFPALTSISHYCFSGCANLSSVNLPDVSYLGRAAFGNCPKLTYVSVPKVTAYYLSEITKNPLENSPNISFANFNGIPTVSCGLFYAKTSLVTVYAQAASTTAKSAFLNCTALKSVYLNNAKTLGEDTFKGCTALTLNSCNFGTALSLIGVTAFEGCTGITSITNAHFPYNSNVATFTVGVQAFLNCTGLTTINNSTITNLSKSAFQGCTALTTVNLPKLALIANETVPFSGCTNLKTVSLATATTLGVNAFSNITTLTSISVPACTTLSNYALYNTGLTSFYGPKVTLMNGYVFQNTPITTISLPLCTYVGKYALSNATLQSINMPAWNSWHASGVFSAARTSTLRYMNVGFTGIPKYFSNCTNLSTVIANKCTALVRSQFLNCAALTTISFPVCLTVASNAFQGCAALTSAEFPAATKISANAFNGCTNLSTLRLANGALCALQNSNAFTGTKITTTTGSIYVPTAWVASYKAAANWSLFSNRIFGF